MRTGEQDISSAAGNRTAQTVKEKEEEYEKEKNYGTDYRSSMAMGLAGCGGSAATATTAAPAETEKTTEAAVTEAAGSCKIRGL